MISSKVYYSWFELSLILLSVFSFPYMVDMQSSFFDSGSDVEKLESEVGSLPGLHGCDVPSAQTGSPNPSHAPSNHSSVSEQSWSVAPMPVPDGSGLLMVNFTALLPALCGSQTFVTSSPGSRHSKSAQS